MMQKFIGVKLIAAMAMTALSYHEYRGWNLADGKDPDAEGYLVEYEPDPNSPPNHENHAGYVSWSPKHVFDAAYRQADAMTFGLAIEALKRGERVARNGWNGKDMWLSLSCNPNGDAIAGKREIAFENFWSENNSEYARQNGGSAVVLPCITMKTATGEILMGWLASQTDMLAEDWEIVA